MKTAGSTLRSAAQPVNGSRPTRETRVEVEAPGEEVVAEGDVGDVGAVLRLP